jgi:hypothetical protein
VLVGAWAWRGEWFDAYDALLWLAAFVLIELEASTANNASAGATVRPTPL